MTQRPHSLQGRHQRARARGVARTPILLPVAVLGTVVALVLSVLTVVITSGPTTVAGPVQRSPVRGGADRPTHEAPPRSDTGSANAQGGPAAGSPATVHGEPRKVFELAGHPLLQGPHVGLPRTGCTLPNWDSSPAAARQFFTAARQCLDAAWGPALRRYGLPFHPPELHFPTGDSFRTQCGTIEIGVSTAAYYCEGDLYVPYSGLQTAQYGHSPGIYLALFAHEYGHHVQELAGIMDAAWQRIYRAGRKTDQGLEMARRKELQAQCLSGMFMATHVGHGGDITQRMFATAWMDQASRGDDKAGTHNHGSNEHYAHWWRTGARSNNIAACNTFAAPSSAVS